MIEDRTAYIDEHLSEALKKIGAHPAAVDLPTFRTWPLQPQYRFGILAPVVSEDEKVICAFCPELLAASAALLDDEAFVTFVETLEVLLLQHCSLIRKVPDGDERHDRVEEFLEAVAPDHFRVVIDVRMHAQDVGLVASAGPVEHS